MQWAATTSVDFLLAQLIHQVIILLSTGGKNGGGYEASKYVVIAFHGGILFLHGVINSLPRDIILRTVGRYLECFRYEKKCLFDFLFF